MAIYIDTTVSEVTRVSYITVVNLCEIDATPNL